MKKIGQVLIVVFIVTLCYFLLIVIQPTVVELVETANTTMTAVTANVSAYPGSQDTLIATPLILWFVPGVIGMIAVVIILRQP